jgi:hypothetical protein
VQGALAPGRVQDSPSPGSSDPAAKLGQAGLVDADVIMVHGFIDESGRFQGLSVAFPPAFPHAQFVLDALRQWQFRPAAQDGQPIKVEVLLIVPEESQ